MPRSVVKTHSLSIAAYTASRRQRAQLDAETIRLHEQLDAESERLSKQLDAESERLRQQLAHDRAAQDLTDLRQFLDDAAAAIERASDAITDVWLRKVPPGEHPPPDDATTRIVDDIGKVMRYARRFDLRFANDHPVRQAYWATTRVLADMRRVAMDAGVPASQEQQAEMGNLDVAFVGEWLLFARAAKEVIGAQL